MYNDFLYENVFEIKKSTFSKKVLAKRSLKGD